MFLCGKIENVELCKCYSPMKYKLYASDSFEPFRVEKYRTKCA